MASGPDAQAQPQLAPAPANVVNLQASGQVEVAQDWLTLTLNTTRDGQDAATVQAQVRQALDAALSQARPGAQPGQVEVRTGNMSLYPRHGRDGRIAAWVGSAELVLEGRDFARLAALAGRIQTLTVAQVGFSLSREQRGKVESDAQAQAIERFKAQAETIARGFGFTGYSLREIHVSSSDSMPGVPRPRVMAMEARSAAADAPLPVEAGKGRWCR